MYLETKVRSLRFSMAAKIERDHPVTICQAFDLKLELLSGLRKAMNQNKRLSRSRLQIVHSNSVICSEVFRSNFDVRRSRHSIGPPKVKDMEVDQVRTKIIS